MSALKALKKLNTQSQGEASNPFAFIYKNLTAIVFALSELSEKMKERERTIWLSTLDFEKQFGYSQKAQAQLRHKGLLPYSKPFGGSIFYKLKDIEEIFEAGIVPSNKQIFEQTQ